MKNLFSLIGKYSKLDLLRKRYVFTAIIRTIFIYASPAWAAVNNKDQNKLQIVQNKYLRLITQAHFYVSNDTLHKDLKN
ncbi:putative RNA-directed DNA polymerase from transposon BS, partial [Stegodyphus mimosarum]